MVSLDDLEKMQNYYHGIEREFLEFLHVVPYKDNPRYVHSSRLYGIMHHACTQVESLSKWICEWLKLKPTCYNFYSCYNKINKHRILSSFGVVFMKTEVIRPFQSKNTPVGKHMQHPWWVAYNHSKHQYPKGITNTTLGHTIYSLGSAYILHGIAQTAIEYPSKAQSQNMLQKEYWKDEVTKYHEDLFEALRFANDEVKSEIFVYLTRHRQT